MYFSKEQGENTHRVSGWSQPTCKHFLRGADGSSTVWGTWGEKSLQVWSLAQVGILVPSDSVTKTLPLQSKWKKLKWLSLPAPLIESGLCQLLRQRGGRHVRCKDARSLHCTQKRYCRGFPGGPPVRNLLANAADTGSILGLGAKIPHATEQLSPCATITEPAF